MIVYIYKIINQINNKFYIGYTNNPSRRFNQHCYDQSSKSSIHQAINKYGKENFKIKILYCSKDPEHTLKIIEPLLIKFWNPQYNRTKGGDGVLGYKHSLKTKKFLSKLSLGRKHSLKTKKLMSLMRKGKNRTPKTIFK